MAFDLSLLGDVLVSPQGVLQLELVFMAKDGRHTFQRHATRLRHKEVDVHEADDDAAAKEEERPAMDGVDHVRRCFGDDQVEQPLGGSTQGRANGSNVDWNTLAGQDPRDPAKGHDGSNDVDIDKGTGRDAGAREFLVVRRRLRHLDVTAHNELGDDHNHTADHELPATSDALDQNEIGDAGCRGLDETIYARGK